MNAKLTLVRPRFACDQDPLAALWIVRLSATYTEAFRQLNEGMHADNLRELVGIAPMIAPLPRTGLSPILKARTDELVLLLPSRKTSLARNVDLLGELLGINALQKQILIFTALSKHHPLLNHIVEHIRTTNMDALRKVLAVALDVLHADMSQALRSDGLLFTTRIVSIENNYDGGDMKLMMPTGLMASMFSKADNIQMLMNSFLENAPPPNLTAEAFPHLTQETALLTGYLSNTVKTHTRGSNVLIYGKPGTGKTEYVRWLAASLGKPLYQVRAMDDQGDPISGLDRLSFYQLSQAFLQKSNAVMLFDEIEDIFQGNFTPFDRLFHNLAPAAGKMFIHRLLEDNPVPAIWISNEVDYLEKSFLRRFDFSFEMNIPPIAIRRGILDHYLNGLNIPKEAIQSLAQQEQLSPAQIEKAAKILKLTSKKPEVRESTLMLVVENSMVLLDQVNSQPSSILAECNYQLDYLNPDCDLTRLVEQLKRSQHSAGALCFYGASGTGKTALAHYIAREMALPLLVRRASDILSPYIGETEQKIAGMFKQAQQESSVLLLDEADSFLSERKSASYAWEITGVNEMLTQMERFEGLFICSTNLMQRLDEAALRRFALKIKFDYLRPEQRWRMFMTQLKKVPRAQEATCRAALNQLSNLTPGDFATVRRQATLLDLTLTADELLNRLRQECRSKSNGGNRPVGFIHPP